MRYPVASISAILSLILLSACSTSGGSSESNGAIKTISKLLGGQHDQSVFKDTTVKEELEFEYRVCLGDNEGEHEKMKQCVQEAYAKVVKEKGIGERPTGGTVTIKKEDEGVINDSDASSDADDKDVDEKDSSNN
ncbi:hypothetical protein GCM10009123_11270 [Kangiella japonica]|uniref:Lipoprotein n=1 Tax=Kangiella japonica TaxID=647384 RepID=A0ABN0SXP9_9GAMM